MDKHPLLLFPIPEKASRSKQNPGFGRIHKPTISRQKQRLSPVFTQLQTAFESRRVKVYGHSCFAGWLFS